MSLIGDNQKTSELQVLGSAIASFFSSREHSEYADDLAKICERLTVRTTEGSSHLIPEEYNDFCSDPLQFSAVGKPEDGLPLVLTEKGNLYFRKFYEYEYTVAQAVLERVEKPLQKTNSEILGFFDRYVRQFLDPSQALAVGVALQRQFCVLTGGPGTGKTHTIAYILACMLEKDAGLRVALCAPTGKAAYRMHRSLVFAIEQSSLPQSTQTALLNNSRTQTIHRMLGPIHGSVDFKHNDDNPIPYDLVLVDEASMVDLSLMARLCEALSVDTKLILVGDANQLSPVQGGAVFSGLINVLPPNEFSSGQLTELRRFSDSVKISQQPELLTGSSVSLSKKHRRESSAERDPIGDLCSAIAEGRGEDALKILGRGEPSLQFIESAKDGSIDTLIRSGFAGLHTSRDSVDALATLDVFKILCAHNQGQHGVEYWNDRTKSLLGNSMDIPVPLVIGMNDYSVCLFNGDDGVMINNHAYFSGLDGPRMISRSRLPKNSLGYACSIHRSQGSEYDQVLIILPSKESFLLTRELLYVAVSRAKSKVVLVGDEEALIAAIDHVQPTRSGLLELM